MTYNGYKNEETWSVVYWLNNDFELYASAKRFMKVYRGRRPYKDFIIHMGIEKVSTPDAVKWSNDQLDYKELNKMMWEMKR